MRRLSWKEALVERTTQRSADKPVTLQAIEALWAQQPDVDYLQVTLEGRFNHEAEMYFLNTWNVRRKYTAESHGSGGS